MDSSSFLLYVIGFGAIFYFFMIRPQRNKAKQHQDLIRSLEVGDKVMTFGGIYGTIAKIKDGSLLLEVAEGVAIEMSKNSISGIRYDDDEDEEENEDDSEEESSETDSKPDKE